jgi:acetyl-CoA acetyltransferase
MPAPVYVVGVGMTRFRKPLKRLARDDPQYPEYAKVAVTRALEDCGLRYADVEFAAVGSCFSTGNGQRCLYELGMHGIPIFNVANACATGSNALFLARQMVASGEHDCALALGIEIMKPGPLGASDASASDGGASGGGGVRRAHPMDRHVQTMQSKFPIARAPINPQMFGNAGREHMAKYGSEARHFAAIGAKNHRHSQNNPYSQFRDVYSVEEIAKSRMIYEPLTKLQCSPTSDGAACAVLCSEEYVVKHGLQGQAIEIVGQSMKTDYASAFEGGGERSCMNVVGYDMAKNCAQEVYDKTGISPQDVQVVELHDCFSCNELITYEALGLCKEGEGHKMVDAGDNTYGGKFVCNPSGGLISKGHPLGATGLAQCSELCWQLRGEAGPRQVANATVGLQHNLGLGGCCVITMYKKPEKWRGVAPKRVVSGAMGYGAEMMSRL